MRATILTVGDEILIGQVTDTNATYMAAALSEEGITVVEHLSVADSRMGIMSGLDRALEQSDLVLMTGGLGPTKDDITKLVLADYFGAELRLHNPTWKRLQKIFSRYGREATDAHKEQCRLPTGAKIMVNERGTAPGLWLEKDDQVVVSMPGVPYEMQYLMDHEVMRRLKRRQFDAEILRSITILTAGEGESTIAERLEELEDNLPDHMSLAYLPSLGTVRLRISARGDNEESLQNDLEAYRAEFVRILGSLVYGFGKDDLASVVARALQDRGLTLATAESCTGGTLGSLVTALPGASKHYVGGVVAYSNPLKTALLGVPEATLSEFGAVSQETVAAMAEGARTRLGADYALATSGIAGPDGGTPQKPVGTIWIGLATPEGTVTRLLRSGKDRQRNIEYTALHALNLLRLELGASPGQPAVAAAPAKPAPKKKTTRKTRGKSAAPKAEAAAPVKPKRAARKKKAKPTEATAEPAATTKPKRTPVKQNSEPTDDKESTKADTTTKAKRTTARKKKADPADETAQPAAATKPKRTPVKRNSEPAAVPAENATEEKRAKPKRPGTRTNKDEARPPAKPKRAPRRK